VLKVSQKKYLSQMSANKQNKQPGWSLRLPNWLGFNDGPMETENSQEAEENETPEQRANVGGRETDHALEGQASPAAVAAVAHSRDTEVRHQNSSADLAGLMKHIALRKLDDKLSYEAMQHEWPSWRDWLQEAFKYFKPANREWTEAEKHFALVTLGGKHVRDVAMHTAPSENELAVNESGVEPKFGNLVKRVDAAFMARDPENEVTLFRAMQQDESESVREFLERARRQLSLCGSMTVEEKEKELKLLLRTRTVDREEIMKRTVGEGLRRVEEMALLLESLRKRPAKQEAEVHALAKADHRKPWATSRPPAKPQLPRPQTNRTSAKGGRCQSCGRFGGHEPGFRCPAANSVCFTCNNKGHRAEMCPQAAAGPKGGEQSGKGKERARSGNGDKKKASNIHQVNKAPQQSGDFEDWSD
jgi:hypothetical protein